MSTTPDVPSDTYRPEFVDTHTTNTDLRGEAPSVRRPVSDLTPNLRQVRTLPEVRNRFNSDYQMVARDLVNVRDADPPERAERTFEYFSKYAERFVEIGTREEQRSGEADVPEGEQAEGKPGDPRLPGGKGKPPELPGGEPGGEPLAEALPEDGEALPGDRTRSRLERLEQLTPDKLKGMAEPRRTEDPALLAKLKELPPPVYKDSEKALYAQQFAQSLKDLSFEQLRDARTGKDGVTVAYELLTSASLKELQQKLERLKMTAADWPPPAPTPKSEELVKEQAPQKRAAQEFTGAPLVYKDIGESPGKLSHLQKSEHAKDGVELRVNTLAADGGKVVVKSPDQEKQSNAMGAETDARRRGNKKLGGNTLWNVLHTYRQEGADSATEKANWDRLTFGAMLFLVLTTLVAIVLVAM